MSQKFLIQVFKNAVLEFDLASTDDDRFNALREMSRIQNLAAELYGFDFADSLKNYL